jgi:hypothetical protein
MNELAFPALLLANLAATLFMTGVIWFVQVVHYPLFDAVCGEFAAYHKRHSSLTTWVVGPPMLVEAATAALLIFFAPSSVAPGMLWTGLALVVVTWISTAALQVPCHNLLAKSFASPCHKRLVITNWLRTAAWTTRSGLMLWIVGSSLVA